MAKARSKKKAKSGSKSSKTKAKTLKRKPVIKAKSAKSSKAAKAKKPAPKKKVAAKKVVAKKVVAKKVVAKKVVAKAPAKKVAAKATAPRPPAPKATPVSAPRKPLPPQVANALSQADVEGLISRLPPPVQPVVKTLRRLVLEAAPEASELLDDGSPSYFANGVFARIIPSERSVLVKFLRGGQLESAGELSGDGEVRSLTLSSVEELKETVLRKIVREAVMLNLSTPITVQA